MTDNNEHYFDMIPLYMDDLLSPQEKKNFKHRLEKDPQLMARLEEFKMIGQSYEGLEQDLPSPSADVFERIMDKIETEAEPAVQKASAQNSFFTDFVTWLFDTTQQAFSAPKLAWSVAAVQMVVLLVIIFSFPGIKQYDTLSQGPSTPAVGTQINVVFDETAQEKEIRSLLTNIDANITSGPGENGLYVISIKKGLDKGQILAVLKKSKVIKFAQTRLEQTQSCNTGVNYPATNNIHNRVTSITGIKPLRISCSQWF